MVKFASRPQNWTSELKDWRLLFKNIQYIIYCNFNPDVGTLEMQQA